MSGLRRSIGETQLNLCQLYKPILHSSHRTLQHFLNMAHPGSQFWRSFLLSKTIQTTLCCVVLFSYLHFASSFSSSRSTLQLHGDYGKPCNITTTCKGDLMCCGCSWGGRPDRGICLDPTFDQCNWEMGCLTQDGQCGCAHSRCEPYDSVPCHDDPQNYKCAPYAGSSDMKKCGY